jgi:hypothetical protein
MIDLDFNSPFATIDMMGGRIDYSQHNKGVTPIFFIEPVVDGMASEVQGRAVYRNMERCRIQIAGDTLSAPVHPVDDAIIARFHEAYEAWKRKQVTHISGTPLAHWPLATPGMIKELEYHNIHSVEDLSALADSNLHNIADGRVLREKATAWLAAAKNGAAAMKFAAEGERLREEMAELREQIRALGGHAEAAPVKKTRKRRKDAVLTPEATEIQSA